MRSRILAAVFAFSLALPGVAAAPAAAETALFAGGCFWCLESDMDAVAGVTSTESGYAGGTSDNPTYKTYEQGGHREVVKVEFDPGVVSYSALVSIFLRTIDVTDAGGQFCDRGYAYSTAVYALDDAQARQAKAAIAEANRELGGKVVTPVEPSARFWPAEDYHQNYYRSSERTLSRFGYVKRSDAYKGYRKGCGRDERVRAVWGGEAYKGVSHKGS